MKRFIILIVIFLVIASGILYYLNSSLAKKEQVLIEQKPIVFGFSMGSTREERWFKDRDLFIKRAQELGADVIVTLSDFDVDKQISQIENLISQKVDVIVIIPSDSEKLKPAIEEANDAGVKVIAYDRLIKNSNIDLYISFDNVKVGELEASSVLSVKGSGKFAYIGGSPTDNNAYMLKEGSMKVLDPKIKDGSIDLVIDKFVTDWKPEEAYKIIKEYLNSGKKIDAVVAANDGTASGVIQALKEKGLSGKVPVSGQDAELSAVQRIAAGTQTSTVYKPIGALAYKAAEIAMSLANDQAPETNNSVNNGLIDVPSYLIEPVLVNKTNITETIVKDNFHTYQEVYGSSAK